MTTEIATKPRPTAEQDQRLRLFNALLSTPHRALSQVWPVHKQIAESDPRFYVRLAAWYADRGEVRDHKEMFVVTLALSDFPGHRDVGLALLRDLPPYEVVRVLDFISGRKVARKVRARAAGKTGRRSKASIAVPPPIQPSPSVLKRLTDFILGRDQISQPQTMALLAPAMPTGQPESRAMEIVLEDTGLFRNPPRSLCTEIARYLREREADADWFDSSVLVARKAMKRLYALNHVAPCPRAQRVLFDNDPPQDSRLYALRLLSRLEDPAEQARAIIEHQVPYRVAASVIRQMTPAVLLALVERMSPQEVINNVASLSKRGAMDVPELKALVERKLAEAKSDARVSALKAERALEHAEVSQDIRQKLEQVSDARVKARGRIKRPTALLIDKSGSMSQAIEIGKRIGALVSAVCDSELFVYAFDTAAYQVERGGDDLASWERALAGINAGGGTSCGAAVEALRLRKQYVEQIILVTDEEENTAPLFAPTLAKYRESMLADPGVCVVRLGQSRTLEQRCAEANIVCDVFEFAGDYYSLPNLVPLLSRPSKLELLLEIMDYPLPKRRAV